MKLVINGEVISDNLSEWTIAQRIKDLQETRIPLRRCWMMKSRKYIPN